MLDLAHIIGVGKGVQVVSERANTTVYHFLGEALVAYPNHAFPWPAMGRR